MKSRARLTRALATCFAIALAGLFAACGGSDDDSNDSASGGQGASSEQLTIVASGADTYPYMALLTVANKKGWFEDEGLDVKILAAEGGGDTVRVATTGSADIAISSGTTIVPVSQDGQLKLIGAWYQINDFKWVTPEDVSMDDLRSASLGFPSAGGSAEMVVESLKKKFSDVKIDGIVAGSLGEQWAAAKAGRLTGALSLPPYTEQITAEEGANTLIIGRNEVGDVPANLVSVVPAYAEEHPEALRAFWRVADRAMRFAQDQPEQAADAIGEEIPVDPRYILEALKEYHDGYTVDVDVAGLETLSGLMESAGAIEEPVDWGELMDQSFLPQKARAEF